MCEFYEVWWSFDRDIAKNPQSAILNAVPFVAATPDAAI